MSTFHSTTSSGQYSTSSEPLLDLSRSGIYKHTPRSITFVDGHMIFHATGRCTCIDDTGMHDCVHWIILRKLHNALPKVEL